MNAETPRRDEGTVGGFPRIVALLAGLFFLGLGLWAMASPGTFFDTLATFDPYNEHFVQDIGAFQIGLGVVLLIPAALGRADGLTVALLGVGLGSAAHTVSHLLGTDLGGTPQVDIPFFAIVTALLLVGGILRWRQVST